MTVARRPTAQEERAPERFEAIAEQWDANYDKRSSIGHWWRSRVAAALRAIGPGPGEALDAGMGSGRLLEQLVHAGWDVHGIDASPRMVELARARVPEVADRLELGRLERLPYPDASFDAVVAIGVLEYTDLDLSIPELARVTRPGGRLILGFRNRLSLPRVWRDHVAYPIARALHLGDPPRRRACSSRQALREALRERGLEVGHFDPACCSVLPYPLELVFSGPAVRLAELAERNGSARTVFAMQLVLTARKLAP